MVFQGAHLPKGELFLYHKNKNTPNLHPIMKNIMSKINKDTSGTVFRISILSERHVAWFLILIGHFNLVLTDIRN